MTEFAIDQTCSTWPVVRPWIEDACEHGDGWWTLPKLTELLAEGRAVLWVLSDGQDAKAAVVTAVADWDGVRVAELIAQGGSGALNGTSSGKGGDGSPGWAIVVTRR